MKIKSPPCPYKSPSYAPHLITYLPHTERIARITVESLKQGATINGDDITILQYGLVVRNAVYNDIIHRSANTRRERVPVRVREILERRYCPVVANELLSYPVKLQS